MSDSHACNGCANDDSAAKSTYRAKHQVKANENSQSIVMATEASQPRIGGENTSNRSQAVIVNGVLASMQVRNMGHQAYYSGALRREPIGSLNQVDSEERSIAQQDPMVRTDCWACCKMYMLERMGMLARLTPAERLSLRQTLVALQPTRVRHNHPHDLEALVKAMGDIQNSVFGPDAPISTPYAPGAFTRRFTTGDRVTSSCCDYWSPLIDELAEGLQVTLGMRWGSRMVTSRNVSRPGPSPMHHAMVLIAIVCITDDFCIFVFWDPQRKMLVLMKERLPRQDVAKFEQIETYPDENQVSVGPGSVGNDHDGQEVEITIGHTERPR